MLIHQALAELQRRFPNARHHEARIAASLPNNPGWRCLVSVWDDNTTVNHFGRGETFEGAISDMERRDQIPAYRVSGR